MPLLLSKVRTAALLIHTGYYATIGERCMSFSWHDPSFDNCTVIASPTVGTHESGFMGRGTCDCVRRLDSFPHWLCSGLQSAESTNRLLTTASTDTARAMTTAAPIDNGDKSFKARARRALTLSQVLQAIPSLVMKVNRHFV
jgi:hypothetical protein